MAYAVFAGDGHYHLLRKAAEHRTLCGLPTVRRRTEAGEYLPPGRVTVTPPAPGRYRSCPRCVAEVNAGMMRGGAE